MSKNVLNTILPLSITVPSSRGSACMPYQSANKKKQPSPVYSKIVKQPQKIDKQKQKSKQNTNISIKTMQNSIQNLRSALQKKQDNKDKHTCLEKDKMISQRPNISRNQYAGANVTKHQCCVDKKMKNVSNKSSQSLGKIKITNNPKTHSKTNDPQVKYKSTTGTNFTKYGKLQKFIKQANKKTKTNIQKQENQQMPVINIQIQFSEKLEEQPNIETKNRSIIQTLQQPTNFIDQSLKNSPVPYHHQYKKGKLSEDYQTLSKKCQSERKMKRYHYLQSMPTQIVTEISNNITKQQPKQQFIQHNTLLKPTKNNTYQNFRLKRSQENSMNQLSQKNSINEGIINKNKKIQESNSINKYQYPITTNKFHPTSSQPFRSINEKSNSLLKNNGSFTHILGYMDKANRSRQRSLESRSKGSIRQHSIEFDLNKFQNRSKEKFNNVQTSKSRHKLKYNYLEQVEVEKQKDRQKDRLKQKQRQLLQRQRKLMEKEKDIQRKKRRQFDQIEKQRQRQKNIEYQRERQRQRRRIEELDHKLRKTKQVQREIQRRRDSQRQRVQIKNTRQVYSHTNSPLKNQLASNNSLKYLNFNQSIKDVRAFNYLSSQQSSNRHQNAKSTQKIIFTKPIQQVNANNKNFSTPFKSTAKFKIDQVSHQSPIDHLLPQANQNYGSARTNLRQKQCICKHQCQCKNLTGELNTSRLNRINNKLQQYIAKNMKSGRDYAQYAHYY